MKRRFPGVDIDAIHKRYQLKERERKCKAKGCRKTFNAISSLQKACSPECAMKLVRAAAEKDRKRDLALRREKLKTRRDYEYEAQKEFNAYIRERDRKDPCISCGRHHNGQYHAGHYLPTSSHPELRFNEDNVHKQCFMCNHVLSANLILYRKALITKIGQDKVDWLEGPHEPIKLSIEDLKELRKKYRVMTKALKWGKAA